MDTDPLLEIVLRLARALEALDAALQNPERAWALDATSFADEAHEHTHRALESAITVAVASGFSIDAIEQVTGSTVDIGDWFDEE